MNVMCTPVGYCTDMALHVSLVREAAERVYRDRHEAPKNDTPDL